MIGRRGFLGGLFALVTTPVLAKLTTTDSTVVGTVNASHQTGHQIVGKMFGTLRVGDVVTFEGVKRWDRIANKPREELRQFVVTWTEGNVISLYPPIIPLTDSFQARTVDEAPLHKAKIRKIDHDPYRYV